MKMKMVDAEEDEEDKKKRIEGEIDLREERSENTEKRIKKLDLTLNEEKREKVE